MDLKNRFVFSLALLMPLALIMLVHYFNPFSIKFIVVSWLIHVFVYHPFVFGLRLVALGKIKFSEFWKTFIPFWNLKYYDYILFNK